MKLSASISRLRGHYSRNGFRATLRRTILAIKRLRFANRHIVFYCDLIRQVSESTSISDSATVERVRGERELNWQDLEKIVNFWNPKLARRNVTDRFGKGASLWLVKCEGQLAGFGWTIRGCTIEPQYYRLGANDIHFFDFFVFPQYRGRGMNPFLVGHVLASLAFECQGRAFIEVAEWNQAQLTSLRKTPFYCLGAASKFSLFGKTIVCWDERAGAQHGRMSEDRDSSSHRTWRKATDTRA
jgi:Acetyltransferase (GNAT) family